MRDYFKVLCTAALLLASLVVPACNKKPTNTCADFKSKSIDTENWGTLATEAARCLSHDEYQLYSSATSLMLVRQGQGKTIGQILEEQKQVEEDAKAIDLPTLLDTPKKPIQPQVKSKIFSALEKAPVFIYPTDEKGKPKKDSPEATGFIVSIPIRGAEPKLVLITCRHVVDPEWAKCKRQDNPKSMYIRLNKIGEHSGVGFEKISLVAGDKNVFRTSPEEDVDLAAIVLPKPASHYKNSYDVLFVNVPIFATDEEIKLSYHDNLVVAGLSIEKEEGREPRNSPSTRFLYITDVIEGSNTLAYCDDNDGFNPPNAKDIRVWHVTPGLPGGFSGSPIFTGRKRFYEGQTRGGPVLIGIQAMHLKDQTAGGITPVSALYDLIKKIAKSWQNADLERGFPPPP
jgi:hypothetical protein